MYIRYLYRRHDRAHVSHFEKKRRVIYRQRKTLFSRSAIYFVRKIRKKREEKREILYRGGLDGAYFSHAQSTHTHTLQIYGISKSWHRAEKLLFFIFSYFEKKKRTTVTEIHNYSVENIENFLRIFV